MQTTPPITRAAIIPYSPERPEEANITLESRRVMRVIPETGLVPTIAVALAATEVKRKLITRTTQRAIKLIFVGEIPEAPLNTESRKKRKTTMATRTIPAKTRVIGRSRSVLFEEDSREPLFLLKIPLIPVPKA